MAFLRRVRHRGPGLTRGLVAPSGVARLIAVLWLGAVAACDRPDPAHLPDEVLRRELGLTDDDRVHTITIRGGGAEVAEPALDTVPAGAWVQFVSADWLVHEIAFEADSLSAAASAFLTAGEQMTSPPLIHRDARFVLSFEGAPAGRYPYLLEGNGAPGRGVIVVEVPEGR